MICVEAEVMFCGVRNETPRSFDDSSLRSKLKSKTVIVIDEAYTWSKTELGNAFRLVTLLCEMEKFDKIRKDVQKIDFIYAIDWIWLELWLKNSPSTIKETDDV